VAKYETTPPKAMTAPDQIVAFIIALAGGMADGSFSNSLGSTSTRFIAPGVKA